MVCTSDQFKNKIINIYELKEEDKEEVIRLLREEILNGKIIVCGTDTLYGISANALDEQAVKRVYYIKKRDLDKPLSICVKDKKDIKKYAHVNNLAEEIIDNFLPGALTVVLKKKSIIPDIVSRKYIGVRIPDEKIIRDLSIVPLTTTSANISGKQSPTCVEEIDIEILKKVDYIIDVGKCKYSKPSTIIKIEGENISLIREGVIPFSEILKIVRS